MEIQSAGQDGTSLTPDEVAGGAYMEVVSPLETEIAAKVTGTHEISLANLRVQFPLAGESAESLESDDSKGEGGTEATVPVLVKALNNLGEPIGEIEIIAPHGPCVADLINTTEQAVFGSDSGLPLDTTFQPPPEAAANKTDLENADEQSSLASPQIVSGAVLKEILQEAGEAGASIQSTLGDSITDITKKYEREVLRPRPKVRMVSLGTNAAEMPALQNSGVIPECTPEQYLAPIKEGELRWIDVESPDETVMAELAAHYKLAPEAVEDCFKEEIFVKRRIYPEFGHDFAVFNSLGLSIDSNSSFQGVTTSEVHAFLGKGFIITSHARNNPSVDGFIGLVRSEAASQRAQRPEYVFCALAEHILSANKDVIAAVREKVKALTDELFDGKLGLSDESARVRLPKLKMTVIKLSDSLDDQDEVIHLVASVRGAVSDTELAGLAKQIKADLIRAEKKVNSMKETVREISTIHQQQTDQEALKLFRRIQLMSFVALPSTTIGAIFGMNFTGIPFGSKVLFASVMGLIGLSTGILATKAYRDRRLP